MARAWNPRLLADVEDALGRGESQVTLVPRLAEAWSAEPRVVKRYVSEVFRRWGERLEASPDVARAELVGYAINMYGDCRRLGHHKSALSALDLLSKLLGLTRAEAQPIALAVLDGRGALTSSDEVRARLAELRQRQLVAAPDDDEGGGGDPSN